MRKLLVLGCAVLLLLHLAEAATTAFGLRYLGAREVWPLNPLTYAADAKGWLSPFNATFAILIGLGILALLWVTRYVEIMVPIAVVVVWSLCACRLLVVVWNIVQILKMLQ